MIKKPYHKKSIVQMEYTFQECGDILGCSAQAVEQVERRALQKVTRILKEKFGDSVSLNDLLPLIHHSMEEYV